MDLSNNYLQVCQCKICQADGFDKGDCKEFVPPISPAGIITISANHENKTFIVPPDLLCKTTAKGAA